MQLNVEFFPRSKSIKSNRYRLNILLQYLSTFFSFLWQYTLELATKTKSYFGSSPKLSTRKLRFSSIRDYLQIHQIIKDVLLRREWNEQNKKCFPKIVCIDKVTSHYFITRNKIARRQHQEIKALSVLFCMLNSPPRVLSTLANFSLQTNTKNTRTHIIMPSAYSK